MRVNGSLLGKCVDKHVSLIGQVQMVHPDSLGFNVTTADGYNVSIKLKKPVSENVTGLVEVHGTCQGPSSVTCDYFITFPYNLVNSYDAAVDNDAINLGFNVKENPWN